MQNKHININGVAAGVVLFDTPKEPETGWAYSPALGAEAIRVEHLGDVRGDVLWVTNVDPDVFWKLGLAQQPNLRANNYLRVSLRTLMLELGLLTMPTSTQATTLGTIANRVVMLAQRLNVGCAGAGRSTLSVALREQVVVKSVTPSDVGDSLRQALQPDSATTGARAPGASIHTLRRNRALHNAEILTCPVPVGAWQVLPAGALPPPAERARWVAEKLDQPALVHASVRSVDARYAEICAVGASQGRADIRQWFATPEIAWLSQIADLSVQRVLVNGSYGPLPLTPRAQAALDTQFGLPTSVLQLSVSVGLLLDSMVTALTLETFAGSMKTVSASAVWLSSIDRAITFCEAVRVAKQGLHVAGYGRGSVRVAATSADIGRLCVVADSLGLVTPVAARVSGGMARHLDSVNI